MSYAITHPVRLWAGGGALLALLAAVLLISSTGAPSRGALLTQLERPAVAAPAAGATAAATMPVGPGPVVGSLSAAGYRASVQMAPNRASRADAVAVTLTRSGAPVAGARVSATYSMPAMNMWNVLTTPLAAAGGGRYQAREPELAMAGTWQVRLAVAIPGRAPFALTLEDRMRG